MTSRAFGEIDRTYSKGLMRHFFFKLLGLGIFILDVAVEIVKIPNWFCRVHMDLLQLD